MVGRRTQRLPSHLHTKLGPAFPVQGIDELGHKPCSMIRRQQLVKRRWQHPHLLSTHLPKRHVRSACILGSPHPKPGKPSDAIVVRSQPDF